MGINNLWRVVDMSEDNRKSNGNNGISYWNNWYGDGIRIRILKQKLRQNTDLLVINYILENQYSDQDTFDDYGETTDRGPIEYRRLHVR